MCHGLRDMESQSQTLESTAPVSSSAVDRDEEQYVKRHMTQTQTSGCQRNKFLCDDYAFWFQWAFV